ncbi:MAG: N-acetylmuramoyl-L-alanine amidase [Cyclobacteriaceae bacterium]
MRRVGGIDTALGAFTAIAIRSGRDLGAEISVAVGVDTVLVPLDNDAPDYTYFISLPKLYVDTEVRVIGPSEVDIFLINSGDVPKIGSGSSRISQDDCLLSFKAISQAEWRAGIASPSYSRSFTEVSHVVIHHSAGSNTNMDYTQVVRDIYLYHTGVNGWSDIGYNYLIAQNGDIYAGRDPDTGEQDNVRGAHFCGKNSGTMGVCLLGNYETAFPTDETIESLKAVLSYKLSKESLDPMENYPHAFGEIGSIVGHKDGCNTLCPGENVYSRIAELKVETQAILDDCAEVESSLAFSASNTSPDILESVIFTNESVGYDGYAWILESASMTEANWEVEGSTFWSVPGQHSVSLIGLKGEMTDTLKKEDLILVEGPLFYPSVLESGASIILNKDEGIEFAQLVALDGTQLLLAQIGESKFQLPLVEAGVYVVRLKSESGVFDSKVLVR